jgi:hypothetical protein
MPQVLLVQKVAESSIGLGMTAVAGYSFRPLAHHCLTYSCPGFLQYALVAPSIVSTGFPGFSL